MSTVITRAIESRLAEVRGRLASLSIEAIELENALATMQPAASEPELLQPAPSTDDCSADRPDRQGRGPWTAEEIETLRTDYPRLGAAVADLLPGRSVGTIYQTAKKFGIKRARGKQAHAPLPAPALATSTIKQPRTFEDDLEAVRNGARLVEVHPIRMPPPDRTLGGVSPEII